MRTIAVRLLAIAFSTAIAAAQAPASKTFNIYLVDVEGGNATLFVAPSGQSVLIDTGNGGAAAARDADRIMAAVKDAGLKQIDHLITTHWHGDHFGGMAELAGRIPIRNFIDHGPNVQAAAAADEFLQKTYPGLYGKARHTVAKPGDTVPLNGVDWRIATSGGEVLKAPLAGAGQANPYCAAFKPQDVDKTENAQSVGSVITFGRFRVAHLGDLTWNKEFDLMCPTNRIGTVDLFVVSHHGQPISNSEVLVHALRSRVGIMNNGTRKGGQPDAMRIIHSAPGLEDLWQLHFSLLSGQEYTVPGLFIANTVDDAPAAVPVAAMPPPQPGAAAPPPPAHNGPAYWIKVSAQADGSFTVTNARNGFSKTYRAGASATAERWWSHVTLLADDSLQGRDTGSEGYRKAAAYVAAEFQKAGLQPSGANGYLQPVKFQSRRIVEEQSSLALVRDGKAEPVTLGAEATFSMRVNAAPRVEAPLVFVGYGLKVPELDYDDFAGLDLRGKVAVLLAGAPSSIAGPLLSHYQSVRWSMVRPTGAIGVITILNPKTLEPPWERTILSRFQPSLTLADPALDETAGQRLAVTLNPARAEKLFAGSGHSFADIAALADQGRRLPRFAIAAAIRATVTVATEELESPNVVGVLPGTDPALKHEYVALSAHLDHMGVGEPVNGDRIFNGAMDNASGAATLIETATAIRESGKTFKRSVVFVAVTAEEKGLLGSRYFAAHPAVADGRLVANVNVDMFLPLFPLRGVIVQGLAESDLASDLRAAAQPLGVEVMSDPEPERNAFTRSDQYSFIRRGIPSVSLKVGFTKGSPEHEIVRRWRAERYHAPSDEVNQPVDLQAAADFNRLYLRLVEVVANRAERPRWNADSFFRRFASTD